MANFYHYKKKVNKSKVFRDIFFIYIITMILVLLFNTLLLQAYKVPSSSMIPTIGKGSMVLVDKFSVGPKYPLTNFKIFDGSDNIKRGDVIVFISNEYYKRNILFRAFSTFLYTVTFSLLDLANIIKHYESNVYIKRVVGLPGDTIKYKIENDTINLYINNKLEKSVINKEYLIQKENFSSSQLLSAVLIQSEYIVKDDEFYVLGDNRSHSSDSRIWGGIRKKQVVGKAVLKYWPVQFFGVVK